MLRNKGFTLVNLMGLAIGMTCTLLIMLWVQDEFSYNNFQPRSADIYQVFANRNFNDEIHTDNAIAYPLAKEAEEKIPEVEAAVVTGFNQPQVLANGNTRIKKSGYTVGPHFFNVFTLTPLKGQLSNSIEDPSSIVLTASTAKALFGDEDPVGKTIVVDNEQSAKVTAVIEDLPANSTLQFDFVQPFQQSSDFVKSLANDWQNSFTQVFILARPGADAKSISEKVTAIFKENNKGSNAGYFVHPMQKWRLYSDFKDGRNTGGMIDYVKMFIIIAIIILLIACINFMNLSTARSEKRAREVGIRKTLGTGKWQLRLQFYIESFILALLSFVVSVIMVYMLLPLFNQLVNKNLTLPVDLPMFWIAALAIIFATGLVAGSYPALYLSSFNPVKVLKGTFLAGKSAVLPRQILVVGQFVVSIILISATIIVYQQISHVRNRDIGYQPDNLIMIPGSPEAVKNFEAIRSALMQTGMVKSITRTSSPITDIYNYTPGPSWSGKPEGSNLVMAALATSGDFSQTMGVKIIEGRDFSGDSPADSSSMILNASAVKAMGLKNPIGTKLRFQDRDYTLTGIISDVVMSSPYKPVDPTLVLYRPNVGGFLHLRLREGVKPQAAVSRLETIFKTYTPSQPFEYSFVDTEFGKKFTTEVLISKVTRIFAGLAIFICCLGLAGLASFTIEKRFREIGIRKVLGASIKQILVLISTEFLKLVGIAILIAIPVTWWAMHSWLQQYAYHTDINILLFVFVGLAMLLLTLVVVSLNSISAAITKPVKSLRSE